MTWTKQYAKYKPGRRLCLYHYLLIFKETARGLQDYQELRTYSKFPLAVHGIIDGIPVRHIGKNEFENVLDQPLANYAGERLVTYTHPQTRARLCLPNRSIA